MLFTANNIFLNQTLLTFLLCETNLNESIDSGNFSVRGYLLLIRKDPSTHMHVLTVYVKEGLPFAQDLSQKTLQILTYVFDWFCFTQCSVLVLFPLLITFFVFAHSF